MELFIYYYYYLKKKAWEFYFFDQRAFIAGWKANKIEYECTCAYNNCLGNCVPLQICPFFLVFLSTNFRLFIHAHNFTIVPQYYQKYLMSCVTI